MSKKVKPAAGRKLKQSDLEPAIRAHLERHGDAGWNEFQDAGVAYPTLRRWIVGIKAQMVAAGKTIGPIAPAVPTTKPRSDPDRRALARVEAECDALDLAVREPALIEVRGQINRMLAACDLLEEKAVKTDAEGRRSVLNPRLLKDSIMARSSTLRLILAAQANLLGADRVQALIQLTMRRIAETSPATAHQIISDIRAMDREAGMTF